MVSTDTVIIIVAVLLFILAVGFCCHFCTDKRREEELARRNRLSAIQQTPGQNTAGSPVDTNMLGESPNSTRGGTIQNPVEENTPDPIADRGPPTYEETSREPELPPPSYEEALTLSIENLAIRLE